MNEQIGECLSNLPYSTKLDKKLNVLEGRNNIQNNLDKSEKPVELHLMNMNPKFFI